MRKRIAHIPGNGCLCTTSAGKPRSLPRALTSSLWKSDNGSMTRPCWIRKLKFSFETNSSMSWGEWNTNITISTSWGLNFYRDEITKMTFRAYRAVFKWLSKNQNDSNYSDQSQQERTAWWTNHNSLELPVTRAKGGKNHAYMVRLVLVLLLIGWKTGATPLSQSLSAAIAITFDSHLKTALFRRFLCVHLSPQWKPAAWWHKFSGSQIWALN